MAKCVTSAPTVAKVSISEGHGRSSSVKTAAGRLKFVRAEVFCPARQDGLYEDEKYCNGEFKGIVMDTRN